MQAGLAALQANVADLDAKVTAITTLVTSLQSNVAALQTQLSNTDADADVQAAADAVAADTAKLAAAVNPPATPV
jgi:phage shock protein A